MYVEKKIKLCLYHMDAPLPMLIYGKPFHKTF